MKYVDVVRLCLNHLTRVKSRTFLTVAGVAIGIGAIVLLVSLGVGLQKITTGQIATAGALTTLDLSKPVDSRVALNDRLISEIEEKIKNVEKISPSISLPARITSPKTTTACIVNGIGPDQLKTESITLSQGESFTEDKGVILSRQLVSTLGFQNTSEIIGQPVSFQIILEEESGKPKIADFRDRVTGVSNNEEMAVSYLDLNRLKKESGRSEYNQIKVKVKSQRDVKPAQEELKKIGLRVSAISGLIDRINQTFLIIEILLASFGAIGLFIASLGIINTMTISLLERTHEIGIMKCVGASNQDIRRIFNFEAIFISLIGSILGILAGLLVGGIFNFILHYMMRRGGVPGEMAISVSSPIFLVAVLIFSVVIGWVAGWYPARKAAKLSPFEALRSE